MKHFQGGDNEKNFIRKLASARINVDLNDFVSGDVVEVAEGELINLRGKIQNIERDGVVIVPEHHELTVIPLFL